MVLMAVVNANYEFIIPEFGVNGRISDGGVIKNTNFYIIYLYLFIFYFIYLFIFLYFNNEGCVPWQNSMCNL